MNATSNAVDSLDLSELIKVQRKAYNANRMPDLELRITRLKTIQTLLNDHASALMDAMDQDFSARSRGEMGLLEFTTVPLYIDYLIERLSAWMQPQERELAAHLQPGSARVMYQPLGVVGIMVPFNYPIFLACSPLATALAAGNSAVIKMPEATEKTSALFAKLIADYFDPSVITVVNGDTQVGATFSQQAFDHLIFTGSTGVGRLVMRAAADNLVPVTLELGGKSPVVLGRDFDLYDAAQRICYGKSVNAGQTCVAPDYALVPGEKIDEFISFYIEVFNKFYPQLSNNQDYTAVIDERHVQRIKVLLTDAEAKGAKLIPVSTENIVDGTRRMAPVIVLNANNTMNVMKEEIFGPILPIVAYDDLDQAIDYINDRPRPLGLYYFGHDEADQEKVLQQTHSGGVAINEVFFQVAVDDIPFGGIGPSGMGHYHGREGFLALSKAKPILFKTAENAAKVFYPPYQENTEVEIK
jgi:coniferyl-aldehyde dehydrogenase